MEIKKPEAKEQEVVEVKAEELGEEFQLPDYRPQSLFTRKQVSRAKKRNLRKIAYKSKRINRIRSKQ
jgi:hypothetical protein